MTHGRLGSVDKDSGYKSAIAVPREEQGGIRRRHLSNGYYSRHTPSMLHIFYSSPFSGLVQTSQLTYFMGEQEIMSIKRLLQIFDIEARPRSE